MNITSKCANEQTKKFLKLGQFMDVLSLIGRRAHLYMRMIFQTTTEN